MKTIYYVIHDIEYIPSNCDNVEVFFNKEDADNFIAEESLRCDAFVARVEKKEVTDDEYNVLLHEEDTY